MIKKEIKKISKLTKLDYKDIEKIYLKKLNVVSLNDLKKINENSIENMDLIEVFKLKREISKELKAMNGEVFNQVPYLPKIKFYYLDQLIEFQKNYIKSKKTSFSLFQELIYYPYIFEIDSFRFRKSFINEKGHSDIKDLERYLKLLSLKYKASDFSIEELENLLKKNSELSYNDTSIIKDFELRELEIYFKDKNNKDLETILFYIVEILKKDIISKRMIRSLQEMILKEKESFNKIEIPKSQFIRKKFFIF